MTTNYFDGLIMPIITACCICIGFVMKAWMPQDDKWIPTVLLIVGAISGAILFGLDYEGIVKGMVSGIAATGLHQLVKQHLKADVHEMTEAEAAEAVTHESVQDDLAELYEEGDEDDE